MEASAANRAEANAITNRLANEYKAQQQRDGRDFSVSGPDTSANPTVKVTKPALKEVMHYTEQKKKLLLET